MVESSKLFSAKTDLQGRWIAVMKHRRNNRALKLAYFQTRCLKQTEIHEFILCGRDVDLAGANHNVSYLGFGEIVRGGVVEVGDWVYCGNTLVGQVVGFDETHMPNHFNILVQGESLATGDEFGLKPTDSFSIRPNIAQSSGMP